MPSTVEALLQRLGSSRPRDTGRRLPDRTTAPRDTERRLPDRTTAPLTTPRLPDRAVAAPTPRQEPLQWPQAAPAPPNPSRLVLSDPGPLPGPSLKLPEFTR